MERYELLEQLLPYVKKYEAQQKNNTVIFPVADFNSWLQNELYNTMQVPDKRTGKEAPEITRQSEDVTTSISKLIYRMYRYARFYTKKAMQSSDINNLDDFGILASLLTHKSLTKKELIDMFILDKTTGVEIINRLIRHGLVIQQDNPDDKRSKNILISDKGRAALFAVFPPMAQTATIITGNLKQNEKVQLVYLLSKLDDFHKNLMQDEIAQLEDVYKKWMELNTHNKQ